MFYENDRLECTGGYQAQLYAFFVNSYCQKNFRLLFLPCKLPII